MVELAWLWTRYQPGAAQVCWFRERVGSTGRRVRKIMIVALARKLLIALWRFVIDGVLPEGAVLNLQPDRLSNPGCAANAEQSGDPRERRRCSAWRYDAVHKEWCRSLGALHSRMRDSGWDQLPPDVRFAGSLQKRELRLGSRSPLISS